MSIRHLIAAVLAACVALASCSTSAQTTTDPIALDGVALFDSSVVHEIEVSFDDDEYQALLATYGASGDKEWIEATVTVDGTTFERAGMRLKGNSSLRGVTSDADPASLPWLIRLDKYVDDQEHQGYADIVIRSNSSTTSFNEAVALDLLDAAGLASQQAVATSFTVNGGQTTLRLAIEHPDDDAWQDAHFAPDSGALYKAESTGDWSYRGDDPAAYDEVFDQEGGSSITDLTPLIDFLEFINDADDATFAAELPERLDVDAFARYLAMMELLDNFDDIDGPGNNAYLWYDVETEQFTVVPWDMNLAFGASPSGQGGPGGPPTGGAPAGAPGGGAPPAGGPGGGFGRSNVLVERFHSIAEFDALYEAALSGLRSELFDSGHADELLQAWVDTLRASATELVDDATITAEAERIAIQL